jgi:endonuclease YncB( thermonuclease family)
VQQPVVVNTDNGNSVELASQVQQLTDEVADLRSEENRRYYDDRARAANSGASLTAKEPAAATIFVFRDGHSISAQSYAITGQTLWIFDEHAARKYQIADLDAASTEKANAANGVEFHVPAPPAPR